MEISWEVDTRILTISKDIRVYYLKVIDIEIYIQQLKYIKLEKVKRDLRVPH